MTRFLPMHFLSHLPVAVGYNNEVPAAAKLHTQKEVKYPLFKKLERVLLPRVLEVLLPALLQTKK